MQFEGAPEVGNPLVITGQAKIQGNGTNDFPELIVQTISAQTAQAISVRNSANAEKFSVDASGNTVAAGTLAVTGTVTLSGGQVSPLTLSALVGATVVLTLADSGKTFVNRATSGTPSWTLPAPAAANSGAKYTFVTSSTTAGQTITCGGGTSFKYHTTAAGTVLSTATVSNTQATAVVGDSITFVSDGTNYLSIAQTGIWA